MADRSESFSVATLECPAKLAGTLLKKSPNPFRFRQYQQRHVEINAGCMSWSAINGMMVRGQVDFGRNRCEVLELKESGGESLFEIRPLEGGWTDADFTGVESGRTLIFDTSKSEHSRSHWIQTLRDHIAYAQKHPTATHPADMRPVKPAAAASGNGAEQRFHLDLIHTEDEDGTYPLKDSWDLRVMKPPIPDRSTWRGVYLGAPKELVEDFAGDARFRHPALPLDSRPGEPDQATSPNGFDDCALRHVMEFINYFFVLQGRPACWYAGIGHSPEEMREHRQTKSGTFAGHFENRDCFACPQAGTGSVYDLMRNCWATLARLHEGAQTWMTMTAADNRPFDAPFGLQAVPLPPRSKRGALLQDPEFINGTEGTDSIKQLASRLFHNGHGPYAIVYKRPETVENVDVNEGDLSAGERLQTGAEAVRLGNDARVFVFPPPGMVVKGTFQDETYGPQQDKYLSRKGLPGESEMGQRTDIKGCTTGGPTIKVHFIARSDTEKYQGCLDVKFMDLQTGCDIPVWISDSQATKGGEHYQESLHECMSMSNAALWVIPKPILAANRLYQVQAKLLMSDESPIELSWSFATFGPRVYDVPSPFPEDTTQSLDWALEAACNLNMKQLSRPDGKPVPSVICVKAGEYHVHARFIDPGPWLHIEGAGAEDTTLVIEAPEVAPTFDFPPELNLGDKGKGSGYEYGWQNKGVPVFNMIAKSFQNMEHDGGGYYEGPLESPPRHVTMSGVTLKLNVPLTLGEHGSVELMECHIVCPTTSTGEPQISHASGGPKVRMSDCSFQPRNLFKDADLNDDGYVDRAEFRKLLQKQTGLSEAEADTYHTQFDLDQDGRLERREFEMAYHAIVLKKNNLGSWQIAGDLDD